MQAPIAIAVSGGADSLYATALLVESGRDVLAVHAHFLPPRPASSRAAGELGRAVEALGARFAVVDLSREFEELVVAPFARAYARSLTPNPCAACNPAMKFGLLRERARDLGAEAFATGHYARVEQGPNGPRLMRGADPAKDQSYFLSLVPRRSLQGVELPLGGLTKEAVLAELKRRGLRPPLPKESQEICFVPGDDYRAFLQARGEALPGPGPIVLAGGGQVGEHQGLWRHTEGQRRGLGVAWSEPLYVVGKDLAANALLVGPREAALARGCAVRDVNTLLPPDQWPDTVLARTRYRQESFAVKAEMRDTALALHFFEPRTLPAPGQVAALYDTDGRVLAGGIIAEQ
ncbi:tRNA-specific 2-thiouridylase [Desulfocurvus sp. DL9XJH121]